MPLRGNVAKADLPTVKIPVYKLQRRTDFVDIPSKFGNIGNSARQQGTGEVGVVPDFVGIKEESGCESWMV